MVPLNQTQLFSNNAVSLLALPITATDTSLKVMAGMGALFPYPGSGEYFLITLEDQAASIREIIKVNSRSGDTFSFTLADRGLEDTAPADWSSAAGSETLVDHRITAETLYRAQKLPVDAKVPDFNADFSLQQVNGESQIICTRQFMPRSTSLYIAGIRQKLGVDYTEQAPDTLILAQQLTQADIDQGMSITIDLIPA